MRLPHRPILLGLLALGTVCAADPPRPGSSPTAVIPEMTGPRPEPEPELERRITEWFLANRCDEIAKNVGREKYVRVRPLVLAAVAFCQPEAADGERLFELAEREEPTGDIVFVLHARYRWRRDRDAARPLWQKVLFLARTRAVKELATAFLEGEVSEDTGTLPVGHAVQYYANLSTGVGAESNPTAVSVSEMRTAQAAAALNLGAGGEVEYETPWGTQSFHYSLTYDRYFGVPAADFQDHSLEIPLSLRAGDRSDVVVRPFGEYLRLGGAAYQALGGLSIRGVAYHPDRKQWVQGSVFRDHYFNPSLQAQEGVHLRFDYNWEWFPVDWYYRVVFFVEHTAADADANDTGTLQVTYSHNDIGLFYFMEYTTGGVTFGFYPKLVLREDDNDSTYVPAGKKTPIAKRRQEIQVVLQPNVSFSLSRGISLSVGYRFTRIFSNVGAGDYLDRNYVNHEVGTALKFFFSSY